MTIIFVMYEWKKLGHVKCKNQISSIEFKILVAKKSPGTRVHTR